MSIRAVLLTLAVLINLPALAQQAELDDATVAERTEAISQTLRCVVCQNQSIADSNATLAEDMRIKEVKERRNKKNKIKNEKRKRR